MSGSVDLGKYILPTEEEVEVKSGLDEEGLMLGLANTARNLLETSLEAFVYNNFDENIEETRERLGFVRSEYYRWFTSPDKDMGSTLDYSEKMLTEAKRYFEKFENFLIFCRLQNERRGEQDRE